MSYATRADLVARFAAGELDDLDPGVEVEDAITYPRTMAALADAVAEIDTRLATAYALPLPTDTTYPVLTAIAADLARLRLYDEEPPKHATTRATSAQALLDAIVSGERALLGARGQIVARLVSARTDARSQVFRLTDRSSESDVDLDNF